MFKVTVLREMQFVMKKNLEGVITLNDKALCKQLKNKVT